MGLQSKLLPLVGVAAVIVCTSFVRQPSVSYVAPSVDLVLLEARLATLSEGLKDARHELMLSQSTPAADNLQQAAHGTPPPQFSAPTNMMTAAKGTPSADFDGGFVFARHAKTDNIQHLLRSLLGVAQVLDRTLVLPRELCDCQGSSSTEACLTSTLVASPFGCTPRVTLNPRAWLNSTWRGRIQPSSFLLRKDMPEDVRRSHVRVLLPDGMDDAELLYALRSYGTTRLLEIDRAAHSFCGWDMRRQGAKQTQGTFYAETAAMLSPSDARGGAMAVLDRCTHYHGEGSVVFDWTPCTAVHCSALQCSALLQCTALHCTALRCTALRCTALHRTALHHTALRCAALHHTALHCTALRYTAPHCAAVRCAALHCTAPHYAALDCTSLYCTALHCAAPQCSALHCAALHCTALHCTAALHSTAQHCCAAQHSTALHCCAAQHSTALHYSALHCAAV